MSTPFAHVIDGEGIQFLQGSDPNSAVRGHLRSNPTLTGTRTWTLPDKSGVISVQDVQFVQKGTDESRLDSITVAVDTALSLPVESNSTYILDVWAVWANSDVNPDFRYGLGGPTGTYAYHSSVATAGTDISGGTGIATKNQTSGVLTERFLIKTAGTAGNVAFYWAQSTQDAVNATTLKGISFIELRKVSA